MKSASNVSENSTVATNKSKGYNQDSAEPQFTAEEKKSADDSSQIEELVTCYLNKSFLLFKKNNRSNEKLRGMSLEQQDDYIQKKFDQLFNLTFSQVIETRIDGKDLIARKGDFQ
jgi:hypothetical protein